MLVHTIGSPLHILIHCPIFYRYSLLRDILEIMLACLMWNVLRMSGTTNPLKWYSTPISTRILRVYFLSLLAESSATGPHSTSHVVALSHMRSRYSGFTFYPHPQCQVICCIYRGSGKHIIIIVLYSCVISSYRTKQKSILNILSRLWMNSQLLASPACRLNKLLCGPPHVNRREPPLFVHVRRGLPLRRFQLHCTSTLEVVRPCERVGVV
jgi:hypothetical protein